MEKRLVRATFSDLEAFEREIESNLRHGGTFIRGVIGLDAEDAIELVLVHPSDGAELGFPAGVVWVVEEGEGAGVGVAIRGFGPAERDKIAAFLRREAPSGESPPPESRPSAPPQTIVKTPYEKLRGLSGAEQQKVAQGGDLSARIQLERMYGKMVWETLLRNPRVTVPEVARIAKMGALPIPLFDILGANTAFLRVPQIRRALLGNPKTPGPLVDKLLHLAPRAELRIIPTQTAYPQMVRERARRLLQQG